MHHLEVVPSSPLSGRGIDLNWIVFVTNSVILAANQMLTFPLIPAYLQTSPTEQVHLLCNEVKV